MKGTSQDQDRDQDRNQAHDGQTTPAASVEAGCRIAGDLIERQLPEMLPMLTAAQRDRLQATLEDGARRAIHGPRRRRVWLGAAAAVALILVGVGIAGVRARPLAFVVRGGAVGEGGWIETGATERATVRFSDGTSIAIAGASAGRISARSADGATFAVARGRARFDVVHRAKAHWLVEAGPFEIAVTGTQFDVDWSAERRHALAIDLRAGSVVVRGALAGTGVSLRAGQRFVADLDRGTVTVLDGDRPPVGDDRRRAAVASAVSVGSAGSTAPGADTSVGLQDPGDDRSDDRRDEGAADRDARVERARPARAAAATAAAVSDPIGPARDVVLPAGPVPALVPPSSPPAASLEPAPWPPLGSGASGSASALPLPSPVPFSPPSPHTPVDTKLAAGGAACLGWAPQVRFDRAGDAVWVATRFSLAFSHPVVDRGRSWCGAGSLRVDARFDLSGAPNRFGDRPHHAGEALIPLPAPVDLTGQTVTVHVFVEGPTEIRFGAQLFAVNGPQAAPDAKWVGGGFTPELTTGRWWTLTHTFERENPLFEGGSSPVDAVEMLTVQVYAIGKDRIWTGRVFVDDVGWQ